VFAAACRMGLEGIVSKRVTRPYWSGRATRWTKTKNPDCPAGAAGARGAVVIRNGDPRQLLGRTAISI
jgi:ATP-dependent DNA ligase